MKEHLATIQRTNGVIADGEAKLTRIDDEERKHAAARDAAIRNAAELRHQATHTAALALIGEAPESNARALEEQADAAERRAASIAGALTGMASIRAQTEAAVSAARAERRTAKLAALEIHAEGLLAEYEANAAAFTEVYRRVRAVEIIRASDGDKRPLLRDRECVIPATIASTATTGMHGNLLFSAERESAIQGAQRDATDAEIVRLAVAGLEV